MYKIPKNWQKKNSETSKWLQIRGQNLIFKKIPFKITPKNVCINLAIYTWPICKKTIKSLTKETKDQSKWRKMPCLQPVNLLRCHFFLPTWSIDSTQSQLKSQQGSLYMESQKTKVVNTIMKKKNKSEGLTLPDFKTYYNVIKMLLCSGKRIDK